MAIAGQENLNGMMEGLPATPPLAGIFNLKAVLSQAELIEAKSGFSPDKYANNAVSGNGDNGPESDEDKKKREKQELERRMQVLSIGGLNISFENVVHHMGEISEQFDQRLNNIQSASVVTDDMYARDDMGRKIETTEELRAIEEAKGFCFEKLAVDQVTMHEGKLISADGYQMIVEVQQEQQEFDKLREGVESGEIPLETLSPEIQEQIKEIELNDGKVPMPEFDLADMMKNKTSEQLIEARMLPMVSVKPTVSFDPM